MISLETLNHISEEPGIYIFRDAKKGILYIGKAKNLKKRITQYFAVGSLRKQDMMHKAEDVEFMVCQSESEALVLESNLIKQHQPVYNRLLKGDNSYVYIKITSHPWPEVVLTRWRVNDGATYIGPKNNTMELRKLIQRLRQFLQYRGCKDSVFKQGQLCNDFVFGLCKGRCVYAKLGEKNEQTYLDAAKRLGFPR
ncbi:MAG: GIY-YIG nuclease family protein [Candidatus Absconditabacterales bacterium]